MASYMGKPLTNDHPYHNPEGLVTQETLPTDGIGVSGTDPRRVGNHLKLRLVFQKPEGIAALKEKREISPGVRCDVEETAGTTADGQAYDAIQRNIRCNHVAICKRGRAGPTVGVRLDSDNDDLQVEEATMSVTFQGVRFDSIDAPELQVALTKAEADLAAKVGTEVKLDAATLNQHIDERIELLGLAEKLGMVNPRQHDNITLKREIVFKNVPALRLDAMPDTLIQGVYANIVAQQAEKAAETATAKVVEAAAPAKAPAVGVTYVENVKLDSQMRGAGFQAEMDKAQEDYTKQFSKWKA